MSEDVAASGDFEAAFDRLLPRAFDLARRIVGDDATVERGRRDTRTDLCPMVPPRPLAYRDAWVLPVAANLAIDETPRRRPIWAATSSSDPDDVITLRLPLSGGLRSLPRRQRQAVALRYVAGLSDSEVAGALGISIASVKTHLHRGSGRTPRRMWAEHRLGGDAGCHGMTWASRSPAAATSS